MAIRLEEASDRAGSGVGRVDTGLPLLGWVILIATAVMSATWSLHKLLEQDEIFSLQTDRVASLGEVLRIQRFYPISLEPPLYHVLSHTAITLFGPNAFALRLPSFLCYLLLQVCLYFFVRNLAGPRAGLVAMAIPALTSTLYYSAEGRPYGVLLGSYALAALCFQLAARKGDVNASRMGPLVGLAVALAFTLNVHFYGVLLLIPIYGALLTRTVVRRRLDGGLLAAILIGTASLAATIPYIKGSSEFKKHYYAAEISVHMLTQPYRQMMIDYTKYSSHIQTALALVIVLAGIWVVWGCIQAIRRRLVIVPVAEGIMILLLVLMPVFAFVLGRTVTHALEVRHSIGAIVGISTLIAIALTSALRKNAVFYGVMTVMLAGIVIVNALRVSASDADSRETMANLNLATALKAEVDTTADRNIYFQDLGQWEVASLYEPDTELRSRLVLVYSLAEEMSNQNHDTMYLTAVHTKKFSNQPIMSYDELRRTPGEHFFATFHSGWSWTDSAFAQEATQVKPMGQAFGGDLVKVRFQ